MWLWRLTTLLSSSSSTSWQSRPLYRHADSSYFLTVRARAELVAFYFSVAAPNVHRSVCVWEYFMCCVKWRGKVLLYLSQLNRTPWLSLVEWPRYEGCSLSNSFRDDSDWWSSWWSRWEDISIQCSLAYIRRSILVHCTTCNSVVVWYRFGGTNLSYRLIKDMNAEPFIHSRLQVGKFSTSQNKRKLRNICTFAHCHWLTV